MSTFKKFKLIFPRTVPVLAGYISLGIAFGILLSNAGYGVLWALSMSVFVYAGSAQFLLVELLAKNAPILHAAILVLILNFRHFFYGISMIIRYKNKGLLKPYLIFGLTDETFALLSADNIPDGISESEYYITVTIFNHIYWISGSVIGSVAGSFIHFNTTGLDFAMTALFAVLVIDQWKHKKEHSSALIGAFVTTLLLIILGPEYFIIPSLFIIVIILLIANRKELKA